jgi:hypothetical protein
VRQQCVVAILVTSVDDLTMYKAKLAVAAMLSSGMSVLWLLIAVA